MISEESEQKPRRKRGRPPKGKPAESQPAQQEREAAELAKKLPAIYSKIKPLKLHNGLD
ncbi:MAG: hypothetical protein LUE08_07090 [Akkermansiaceae bacterium]|nr:hypothetical protein [Akkermansiaceae bacterium]